MPHGLVEPATEQRPEAKGERRARLRGKLCDPLEAENVKTGQHVGRQAERRDRQIEDCGSAFAGRQHEGGSGNKTSEGMGRAPAIGECGVPGNAGSGETRDHLIDHGSLPAVQVRGAGRVDHESVRRIGCDHRRIAL